MFHQKSLLSLFIFSLLMGISIAKTELLEHYCLNSGNYTKPSMFHTNLKTALSFNTTSINYGFYNFSGGQNPDRVHAIGLCRGDVEPSACRSCLDDSSNNLTQLCPNQKEAIAWADNCMIRYANRSILHTNETFPNMYAYNLKNASDSTHFNKAVRSLLDNLRAKAVAGGSMLKYATGNTDSTTSSETIFGLVQCTPDLSTAQCSDCLNSAFGVLPKCCDGRIGGRVLTPSCNFRYEINRFYGQTALSNAPTPQPQATAPPRQAAAPSPSDGQIASTPGSSTPTNGPPPPLTPPLPPQGGGKRNLAFFSLSALMAAVLAISIF